MYGNAFLGGGEGDKGESKDIGKEDEGSFRGISKRVAGGRCP